MKMKWKRFVSAIILASMFASGALASGGSGGSGTTGGKVVTTEDAERHQLVIGLAPGVDIAVINARYGTFTIEQIPGIKESSKTASN